MPKSYSQVIADNNSSIRQQMAKDSIPPDTVADRLDDAVTYAKISHPFPFVTDTDGHLIDDDFIGLGICQIVGNGAIYDANVHFTKDPGKNYVADISDSGLKFVLSSGYPYTITPIL